MYFTYSVRMCICILHTVCISMFSVDCVHSVYHSLSKYSMYSLAIVVQFPFFTEGKSEKKFPAKKMTPKDENVCYAHLLHTHPMFLFVLRFYPTYTVLFSTHCSTLFTLPVQPVVCMYFCIHSMYVSCTVHMCVVFQMRLYVKCILRDISRGMFWSISSRGVNKMVDLGVTGWIEI